MGWIYCFIILLIVGGVCLNSSKMLFTGLFLGFLFVLGTTGIPNIRTTGNSAQTTSSSGSSGNGITQISPQTDGSGNIVVKQNGQTVIIPPMFPPQKQPDK